MEVNIFVTVVLFYSATVVDSFYDSSLLSEVLRSKNLDASFSQQKKEALDYMYMYSGGKTTKDDAPTPTWVKKVHIVSMNHLDVGYDGIPGKQTGFINNVLNYYFHEYFPRAIRLGRQLRSGGYVETFRYTTHPWLVSMYLDCPPNFLLSGIQLICPSRTDVDNFVKGVHEGYITWHAGPMNMQPEFAPSPESLENAIEISKQLDKRFGITRPTLVLSQRDVPGMTQTVIPALRRKGVSGVTVGVNNMTPPPAIHKLPVFRWRYGQDEVLATWHAGGYPDTAGTVPSQPGGLSVKDCVIIPDFPEALCFAFRSDNQGPPANIQEILGQYEVLRAEFPGADLFASRLEDFFLSVRQIQDSLPVITGEIGDTWIQGVASDPRKSAEMRAVGRALTTCYASRQCDLQDARVWNASRLYIKTWEHTWGLNDVYDRVNWSNTAFNVARRSQNYENCENAWQEQRQVLYYAIEALGDHPVVQNITAELKKIAPNPGTPDLTGYTEVKSHSRVFYCGSTTSPPGLYTYQFYTDGSLQKLSYASSKYALYGDFASPDHRLGQFEYRTYNESDFVAFSTAYNYRGISAGYYKKNLTNNTHAQSRDWGMRMEGLYSKSSGCDVYVHMVTSEPEMVTYYGSPASVWVRYTFRLSHFTSVPGVDITLQINNKTTTRLPESISFRFRPLPQKAADWSMSKLGNSVNPYDVILNGSQYEHVLDDGGMTYGPSAGGVTLKMTSPDVPIAILSTATLPDKSAFPAPLFPIRDRITGVGFNIYNNLWDTNYIFWYPYKQEDSYFKARFSLDFDFIKK